MGVVAPDFSEGRPPPGIPPGGGARLFARWRRGPVQDRWTMLSIGLFVGLWELCWPLGWADPKLLPPPHIFLGKIAEQGKFFNTATRWQIGKSMADGPERLRCGADHGAAPPPCACSSGLLIASVLAIATGVLVRYYKLFDRLVLPTITLLSPVSPIAWLPVAIFIFGIGNGPAIFMVVVALFFHMVLATITQIDGVNRQPDQRRPHHGRHQAADLLRASSCRRSCPACWRCCA